MFTESIKMFKYCYKKGTNETISQYKGVVLKFALAWVEQTVLTNFMKALRWKNKVRARFITYIVVYKCRMNNFVEYQCTWYKRDSESVDTCKN